MNNQEDKVTASAEYIKTACGGAIFTICSSTLLVSGIDSTFNQAASQFLSNFVSNKTQFDLAASIPGIALGIWAQHSARNQNNIPKWGR